jgi:hypothetical protein
LVALLQRFELFRLVGLASLREVNRALLRRNRGGESDRHRERRDNRGARFESPEANHYGHVTPAGWDGKPDVPASFMQAD